MCSILDPQTDGILLLQPETLSGPSVGRMREVLHPVLRSANRLIIDLSRVSYMDSAGCGVLLWVHTELKKNGAHLIVCNLAPAVRALFDLLRLPTVLKIVPSREQAQALLAARVKA